MMMMMMGSVGRGWRVALPEQLRVRSEQVLRGGRELCAVELGAVLLEVCALGAESSVSASASPKQCSAAAAPPGCLHGSRASTHKSMCSVEHSRGEEKRKRIGDQHASSRSRSRRRRRRCTQRRARGEG
eukprot:425021-Rhodomonas_salina.1